MTRTGQPARHAASAPHRAVLHAARHMPHADGSPTCLLVRDGAQRHHTRLAASALRAAHCGCQAAAGGAAAVAQVMVAATCLRDAGGRVPGAWQSQQQAAGGEACARGSWAARWIPACFVGGSAAGGAWHCGAGWQAQLHLPPPMPLSAARGRAAAQVEKRGGAPPPAQAPAIAWHASVARVCTLRSAALPPGSAPVPTLTTAQQIAELERANAAHALIWSLAWRSSPAPSQGHRLYDDPSRRNNCQAAAASQRCAGRRAAAPARRNRNLRPALLHAGQLRARLAAAAKQRVAAQVLRGRTAAGARMGGGHAR
jgi:hypothetical protein